MKPQSLMTQYVEGSIVGRELRDMLAEHAASERFDRELALMDVEHHGFPNWESNASYSDFMKEQLKETT